MTITLPETSLTDQQITTPHGCVIIPGASIPERTLEVDIEEIVELLGSARQASASAHAPFSGFRVGAALRMLDDPDHRIFTGSNVENSSYGATNCAERSAIFSASSMGFRQIRMLALTSVQRPDLPQVTSVPLAQRSPCGICRQVIHEFSSDATLLIIDSPEEHVLCEFIEAQRLLPWGFRLERPHTTQTEQQST
jgi:cytidine deaminase